jgi:two-component system cell cycle response regulator
MVLGIATLVTGGPWPLRVVAAAAAALAVIGGAGIVALADRLAEARGQVQRLTSQVGALAASLADEARGRREAEEKLSSRMQLTAVRRATERDHLVDEATGLYSEGWFRVAIESAIEDARRDLTPIAVVLLDVAQDLQNGAPRPADPREVATGISRTVRETDTACRLLDGGFALVLHDTDDNGAVWTVERVRRRLAEIEPRPTVWAGVACYPAHALDVDDLLDQADLALDMAREWRQDRIEVARAPVDPTT